MRMATLPIAVLMQRRLVEHRWGGEVWSAVAVAQNHGRLPPIQQLSRTPTCEYQLVSGLQLELYPDENDGYFENWAAPEPKVFVMWRLENAMALPIQASVSYAEGTRMFDSGDHADGIPMPAEIHAWLGHYLQQHYQPRQRHGRQHG